MGEGCNGKVWGLVRGDEVQQEDQRAELVSSMSIWFSDCPVGNGLHADGILLITSTTSSASPPFTSPPFSRCPPLFSAKYTKLQSKEHPDSETTLHKAQNEEDKMKRESTGGNGDRKKWAEEKMRQVHSQ